MTYKFKTGIELPDSTVVSSADDLGGSTLIEEVVLSATSTGVTFSSIPQTYKDLKLVCMTRDTTASTSADNGIIQFNGDTAANYSRQGQQNAASFSDANPYPMLTVPGGVASGWFAANDFIIPSYTSTTIRKMLQGVASAKAASVVRDVVMWWNSTAAITQIDIKPISGSWEIGCEFRLYGVK